EQQQPDRQPTGVDTVPHELDDCKHHDERSERAPSPPADQVAPEVTGREHPEAEHREGALIARRGCHAVRLAGRHAPAGVPRLGGMPGRYTLGHHESVLRSHRWRTAANSAAYLVPRLRPGMNVLDVGSGPGTITVDLARLVHPGKVVGIDASD